MPEGSVAIEESQPQGWSSRVHDLLHARPALGPLAVLVLACVVFGLANNRFYAVENLSLIAQQAAVVGALAAGQTLVILTAGIDLSVGAVMLLVAFTMANLATTGRVPPVFVLLIGLVLAVVLQAVNGFLVSKIRLPPFIVTLGTFSVYTAVTLIYAGGQTAPVGANSLMNWTARTFSIGPLRVTTGVVLVLALFLFLHFLLKGTAWGRHVYAAGDDVEGARLAGIEVNKVLISAYAVAGLACAVAAWVLIGRTMGADPSSAPNANLESITAVVIGGTSLFGGRGSVLGTLIGAAIVQVFENGLALAGVDSSYQVLAEGLLVIAAVSVDQWIRKVKT